MHFHINLLEPIELLVMLSVTPTGKKMRQTAVMI